MTHPLICAGSERQRFRQIETALSFEVISQEARKERTKRLIALGLLVQKHLIRTPGQSLESWAKAAENYLDAREQALVRDALAEIAVKRSESPPLSPHHGVTASDPPPA